MWDIMALITILYKCEWDLRFVKINSLYQYTISINWKRWAFQNLKKTLVHIKFPMFSLKNVLVFFW